MFNTHRLLSAGALAATLLFSTACAAQSGYYRYPTATPRAVDQRAYSLGYDQGRVRGETDGRRNRGSDYSRYGEYRNADSGYRGNGDRNEYRSVYRQGFIAGYNDGYRRFARNGGGYGDRAPGAGNRYGSLASETGYRDGYAQGREDGRDGDRFDPIRSSRYRSADHDYNNRYGSRDEYKREYRTAFQRGYEQGYREVRR